MIRIIIMILLIALFARITYYFQIARINGLRKGMRNIFLSLTFYWIYWLFAHDLIFPRELKMLIPIAPIAITGIQLLYYLEMHYGKVK